MPLDAMHREPNGSADREIDATTLRTMPFLSGNAYPLFEYPGTGSYGWLETSLNQIDDQYRNPYFAYKAMRRLDNLLTTRSNVYAVWITLGYFEVSPAPSNDPQRTVKYPDGWVLGQEVGSDTGDIKRHRASSTCTTAASPSASNAAKITTCRRESCSSGISNRIPPPNRRRLPSCMRIFFRPRPTLNIPDS